MYGEEFELEFQTDDVSRSQLMKQRLQEYGQYFGNGMQ